MTSLTSHPQRRTSNMKPPRYHEVVLRYELLENILLHATSFEILAAANVCRYWREVLESSKPLRNHLFQCQPPTRIPAQPAPNTEAKSDADVQAETETATVRSSKVVRLNRSDSNYWHFRCKASNGVIFVFRVDDDEVFVFAPASPNSHLIVLDGRYERIIVHGLLGKHNFIWYGETGLQMTKTKCKPAVHAGNSLRTYLLQYHGDEVSTQA